MSPGAAVGRVGLLLAVVACAGTQARDRLDDLRTSVEAYSEAYRWKNYGRAASFRPAEVRPRFLAAHDEEDESLHVEGYQVLSAELDSPDAARVAIRYRYMVLPDVTLKNGVVRQHWARVGGQWLLEHEEDPIRPLEASAPTRRDEAFGGPGPAPSMEVEVVDPSGKVVRRTKAEAGSGEGD